MNIINDNNAKIKRYLPYKLHIRENQLKPIEIKIQLVMYTENIIFPVFIFIVGIKNMTAQKNL